MKKTYSGFKYMYVSRIWNVFFKILSARAWNPLARLHSQFWFWILTEETLLSWRAPIEEALPSPIAKAIPSPKSLHLKHMPTDSPVVDYIIERDTAG